MMSSRKAVALLGIVLVATRFINANIVANVVATINTTGMGIVPFNAIAVQQVLLDKDYFILDYPCGEGMVGTGICKNNSECCSQYGYCGLSKEYCGTGCVTGPCMQCGGGIIGSGVCSKETDCCSKEGFCGDTIQHCHPLYCRGGACGSPTTTVPCGNGTVGNGTCLQYVAMEDSHQCCSQFGYCGRDELGFTDFCGEGCLGGPCMSCGNGIRGNGVCPTKGECCSKTGHCTVNQCMKCDPSKGLTQCFSMLTKTGVRALGKTPYPVNVKPPYDPDN